MKRLLCLMGLLLITACGDARPAFPPYAGVDQYGVHYYWDNSLDITIERASEQMRLTVEAWGGDINDMKNVHIAYTTRPFSCGSDKEVSGCYLYGVGDPTIELLVINSQCPYIVVEAHEIWHHLYSPGHEPTMEQLYQINRVDQIVFGNMLRYCP